MSQKIRLLYLGLSPANSVRVSRHLDSVGGEFLIEYISSLKAIWDELSKQEYDLVLLDELSLDRLPFAQLDCPPIILLTDRKNEDIAVAAIEQGMIADYVLNSRVGIKRLPLVIRAVLARSSQLLPDANQQSFFAQLKSGYDALVVVDRIGKIVYQTKDSLYRSGYSQEELENMNPFNLIHEEDAKNILPVFSKLVQNAGAEEITRLRILHKDGIWHWYDVAGRNMLEDPLVQGILIRYSDITKRRQDEVQQDAVYRIAQAALMSDSLDDLFASIHMIISEVMPSLNFYIALYDAENDLIDFPYYQDEYDEPPSAPAKLDKGLTAYVIRKGQSLLCDRSKFKELVDRDEATLVGTAFAVWLGVPLVIGKQVIGVLGVQHYEDEGAFSKRDQKMLEFVSSQVASVIRRKQTEVNLKESELRFRSLFENATIGIYRSTPDGRLLMVNPALLSISGYESIDELSSIDLSQYGYVNSADRIHFQELLERDGGGAGTGVYLAKEGRLGYLCSRKCPCNS